MINSQIEQNNLRGLFNQGASTEENSNRISLGITIPLIIIGVFTAVALM